MPLGLTQPIRFMRPETQLERYPWQRYQELQKLQRKIAAICEDLQRSKIEGFDADAFNDKMKQSALSAHDCEHLDHLLGYGLYAGGGMGKYFAATSAKKENEFWHVLQEQAKKIGTETAPPSRHNRIKAHDTALDTELTRLIGNLDGKLKALDDAGEGWSGKYATARVAKGRLQAMQTRFFTQKTNEEEKSTLSRKMVIAQLLMSAFMLTGCLAVIAATGGFGAPAAAFVGLGVVKTLLIPAVGLASLGGATVGPLFVLKTAMTAVLVLNAVHSLMYSETMWRLVPFHKVHLRPERNDNLGAEYAKAFIQQLKHLDFLRLPGEEAASNAPYTSYRTRDILFKTLCNPLRLVYSVLFVSHGALNLLADGIAKGLGAVAGIFGHDAMVKTSYFVATVLKSPIDFVLSGVAMALEVILKMTDVVSEIVVPTLTKLTAGAVQGSRLYAALPAAPVPAPSSDSAPGADPTASSAADGKKKPDPLQESSKGAYRPPPGGVPGGVNSRKPAAPPPSQTHGQPLPNPGSGSGEGSAPNYNLFD